MRGGDARSKKVAVVPDLLMNAPSERQGLVRARQLLEENGIGMIVLPKLEWTTELGFWLTITLDQVLDYHKNGYRTFVVGVDGLPGYGVWYPKLAEEYRRRVGQTPVLARIRDQYAADGVQELERMLA
ncbi:MAG: hypothetical protein QN159_08410 [Armatimonadota bacterium]|nr:hypothetical protein [Armatimonadota bacterium]